MFDLTHGFIFAIGSMTLIVSILAVVNFISNRFKKEEERTKRSTKINTKTKQQRTINIL